MRTPLLSLALVALAAPSDAQTYAYHTGATDAAVGNGTGGELGVMHQFFAPAGEYVREIRLAVGATNLVPGAQDGLPFRLGIWRIIGPTATDFELLWESGTLHATQTNTDTFVSYPVEPNVEVTGSFFVGALFNDGGANTTRIGVQNTPFTDNLYTFLIGGAQGVDLALLGTPDLLMGNFGSYVFLLEAIGGGDNEVGTRYCSPALPNSTGAPATIQANGSLHLFDNDLTLTAEGLPANAAAYFLCSKTQGFSAMPGGSQGNLCLGGSIGRFLSQVQNSGASGAVSIPLDLTALPQPTSNVPALAGDTWHFQCWHRDANPASTSNFTDAVAVTFP